MWKVEIVRVYKSSNLLCEYEDKVIFEVNSLAEASEITHHSTYLGNRFIDNAYRERMERRKIVDPEGYQIYGLGEWGEIGGLILHNWEVREVSQNLNDYDDVAIGQDFGFNHADAILLVGIKDENIYIIDEIYEHEKETAEIIPIAIQHGIPTKKIMWCDSAEPDRIKEWNKAGYRARGVDKGGSKGSVNAQIDWLKGSVGKDHTIKRKIYVAPHCVNTIKELQQWKWKKDERTGEYLDDPVPIMDDAMAADSMGVVECREKDTSDHKRYIIYHYVDRIEQGKKVIRKIQVWSETETFYYIQDGLNGKIVQDESEPVNPRPHIVFTDQKTGKKMGCSLGYIPFWRLDYNKKQFSGLKPIKGLIDDYDIMQCGLSNNLKDFDTPLYVVKGFQGDNLDELQQNLKTKKIVGTDSEGDVEVRTVDIPYQARKAKADEDEKNIYRFGMGFNSSQVGDGNITNIVIKSRYALLDLKANKLERRLKKMLKQLLKVVLDEINQQNGTGYQISDVKFEFTRSIMMNESENIANEKTEADIQQVRINTILNMAAQIGDEQTLKALCDVMDWDFDELKEQLKNADSSTAQDARTALSAIVSDDPDNPDDEPVEE